MGKHNLGGAANNPNHVPMTPLESIVKDISRGPDLGGTSTSGVGGGGGGGGGSWDLDLAGRVESFVETIGEVRDGIPGIRHLDSLGEWVIEDMPGAVLVALGVVGAILLPVLALSADASLTGLSGFLMSFAPYETYAAVGFGALGGLALMPLLGAAVRFISWILALAVMAAIAAGVFWAALQFGAWLTDRL